MSKVRDRSWEDSMPKGRWPRGVTPHPRSGAAAESARLRWCRNGREELPKSEVRGDGREELPCVRGQGRWPRGAARVRGQGRRLGGATPDLGIGSSSLPFLHRCSLALLAAAPDLGRGVTPLGRRPSGMRSSQLLPLTSVVG